MIIISRSIMKMIPRRLPDEVCDVMVRRLRMAGELHCYKKKGHIDFHFLYALMLLLYLILKDLIDYANCIISVSISFNSSNDNVGI